MSLEFTLRAPEILFHHQHFLFWSLLGFIYLLEWESRNEETRLRKDCILKPKGRHHFFMNLKDNVGN